MTQTYDIFVDESSQTKSKFLVIGGIVTTSQHSQDLEDLLSQGRLPELPNGEIKWGKVSRAKIGAYKRIVDVLFDFKQCHFSCVVVERAKLDHARFNGGSSDIGFNKEVYQLASKFARHYSNHPIHLYLDQRTTKNTPEELRTILNRGRVKAGDSRQFPFRRCQFRCSKETPLLALPDLMSGALAFRLNGRDEAPDASEAKRELCDYILSRANVRNAFTDTAQTGKFCIWHRRLR